ncbi:MAG: L-threonylcarbamoyladenylate synthase [Dehalococcoidales bacterium]|nr:L-threonylcarbamoyladenylate synthase [Dehalococcoidales bacterium]
MSANADVDTSEQINNGIAILKRGGLVAFPTDTVYGLGACYNDCKAVERVFRVKKRPKNKALPLILAEVGQITEIVEYMPPVARLLASRFMPGALTLVLQKSDAVPDIVTGSSKKVAVRVSAHPVPVALIKGAGVPIIGTSVNISGQPSAVTGDEVRSQFGDEIELVISGRCSGGRESTIIDVTGEIPRVLREGAISRQEIMKVCRII